MRVAKGQGQIESKYDSELHLTLTHMIQWLAKPKPIEPETDDEPDPDDGDKATAKMVDIPTYPQRDPRRDGGRPQSEPIHR